MTQHILKKKSLGAWSLVLIMFFFISLSGCQDTGSSPVNKDIAETDNTSDRQRESSRNEDESLTGALDELGNALKNMGEALSGEVQVEPVDWRDLAELYPRRVRGLEQTGQEGEKSGALGFKVATVKRTYASDDGEQRLELSLVDLGSIKGAARFGVDWLNIEVDREDNNGFKRTTTIQDHPALESCDKMNGMTCEINVFVSNRFIVNLDSKGMEIDKLRDVLGDVDIPKLEEMHDYGVKSGV